MIGRYARIPSVRATVRCGQPTRKEKTELRIAVYGRANGECELRRSEDCIRGELAFSGISPFDHGHLVHMKSRGAGGKWTMENCFWGCWYCHLVSLHNPKPCPPKPKEGDLP